MNWLFQRLFWYLAKKLKYGIILCEGEHFYYTEIMECMPMQIYIKP